MVEQPSEASSDSYVLAREDHEYQRLNAQAAIWEEATRRALTKAGVKPGQGCLDLGCGTGSVMRILGELVGADGAVTGVDIDPRIGALALAALDREQPGRHRFEAADATTVATIPGAPFDVVFARLLIFHVSDQVAMLGRLWSWVAPGGVLVVMEFDLSNVGSFPPNPALDRARDVTNAVMVRAGRDIGVGSRLPLLFVKAGIGEPDGTDVSGLLKPIGGAVAMLRPVARSLAKPAIAMGIIDAPGLESLDAELAAAAELPDSFARGPDMIAAWRRKPA